MDTARFDTLTRFVGSRTSRRAAVGLTVAGLLASATPDADAARCSKAKPCPECKRCRQRRCKPKGNGTACSAGACQNGVCTRNYAGTCDATTPQDNCGTMTCNNRTGCFCHVTVGGAFFCGKDEDAQCNNCTKNSDCIASMGVGAACLSYANVPTSVCAAACAASNNRVCVPPCLPPL
jgi:hypothetical protein